MSRLVKICSLLHFPFKRQIPAEIAVKSPDGNIVPYKRSVTDGAPLSKRQIPAEIAVKSPDGNIVPYKRSINVFHKRDIPVEIAVKAPNGVIVPYWGTGELSVSICFAHSW